MNRGFTLLEVLVAVAILGLGLTAILSAQAGAFASAAHARNISQATGLLRCKMSEVEEHLYREGFQDTDETGSGPCCEGNDDPPNMKCTWHADRPQFPEAKFGDLNLGSALGGSGGPGGPGGALGLLAGASGSASPLGSASSIGDVAGLLASANAQALTPSAPPGMPPLTDPSLAPSGSPSGMPSGLLAGMPSGIHGSPDLVPGGSDPMMGGLASIAMSFVYPSLKLLFEASTRRITATLTFREGKKEYTIDVIEWFAVPQLGLVPADDSATDSAPASGSGTNPASGGRTTPLPTH
jgi:general secretion pathway protein I